MFPPANLNLERKGKKKVLVLLSNWTLSRNPGDRLKKKLTVASFIRGLGVSASVSGTSRGVPTILSFLPNCQGRKDFSLSSWVKYLGICKFNKRQISKRKDRFLFIYIHYTHGSSQKNVTQGGG